MEQYNFKNVQELFERLNGQCNYLIMRNYEDILLLGQPGKEHEDIDFLCDDCRRMVELMDARPGRRYEYGRPGFYEDGIRYVISLGGRETFVDIRHVGDNYYDPAWEKEMLENKRWKEEGFFVMNEADYFYSLIYHAILQKKSLSEDYRKRLAEMASALDFLAETEEDFLGLLIKEMKEKGYRFCYPEQITMPSRFELVPKEMCTGRIGWYIGKVKRLPVRTLSFLHKKKKNIFGRI